MRTQGAHAIERARQVQRTRTQACVEGLVGARPSEMEGRVQRRKGSGDNQHPPHSCTFP
jgi:hypothetical protein